MGWHASPERRQRRRPRRAARAVGTGLVAMLVSLTAAGLLAAGGAAATASASTEGAVTIERYRYGGGELHVETGHTVTWTNADDAPHTVTTTSGPQALSSPELAKGERWTFTFGQPGSYRYTCTLHPDMAGSVIVAAVPGPAVPPAPATGAAAAPRGAAAQPEARSSGAGPGGPPAVPTIDQAASTAAVTTEVTRSTRVSPLLVLVAVTAATVVFGALCFTARREAGGDR